MSRREDLATKRNAIRETIRTAAIAEFSENGLRGASTQGIADRAGITKTKLHYHISSKEELYQEVLDHIVRVWAELFEGIPMNGHPDTFFANYINRKVRYSLEHPAEVKLFVNEVMRGAERLRDHWVGSRETTLRAAEKIENWVAEGLIRPVHPILLQFHIWALTEQYAVMAEEARFMLSLDRDALLDADLITAELTTLVLNGLKP